MGIKLSNKIINTIMKVINKKEKLNEIAIPKNDINNEISIIKNIANNTNNSFEDLNIFSDNNVDVNNEKNVLKPSSFDLVSISDKESSEKITLRPTYETIEDINDVMTSKIISEAMKKNIDIHNKRKTVVLDFDGVIHAYRKGWHDGTIYDDPVPGIKETIQELRRRYHVVIVSTRSKDEEGCLEIKKWLNKHEIVVDDICSEKPPAFVYVDDRAICFNGSCKNLIRDIDNFNFYVDRGRKICKYCNKEFFCTNGNRQYCSNECRIRAQIKREENN